MIFDIWSVWLISGELRDVRIFALPDIENRADAAIGWFDVKREFFAFGGVGKA